jgi:alcohol dehydrogenase class IV
MVIAGRNSARRLGVLELVLDGLRSAGCIPVLFEGVEAEADCTGADAAAAAARESRCDAVVGIGGGAVMDTAKAVAGVARSGAATWQLTSWGRIDGGIPIDVVDPLPVACIPTVAGSGSEANCRGVLVMKNPPTKAVYLNDRLQPSMAVVDPALTVTVDAERTWASAMDIMAHGLEDVLTREAPDPAQFVRCLGFALNVAWAALRCTVDPTDEQGRTALSWLAMEPWNGNYERDDTKWTIHAIAHVIGARYRLGHGFVMARLLPAWLNLVGRIDPSRFGGYVPYLDSSMSRQPPECVEEVDTGVVAQDVLAVHGEGGVLPGWPRLVPDDVRELVGFAFNGRPATSG